MFIMQLYEVVIAQLSLNRGCRHGANVYLIYLSRAVGKLYYLSVPAQMWHMTRSGHQALPLVPLLAFLMSPNEVFN